MPSDRIFHICKREEWSCAEHDDIYPGSSQDQADGFIHFSGPEEVVESVAKHRAGQDGLVLISVDAAVLGDDLRWEPSRGGVLFPHLYADLPLTAVVQTWDLPLGPADHHQFPDHFRDA